MRSFSRKGLRRTDVWLLAEAPLAAGRNALWSAGGQLAWDAMRRDVFGGAAIAVDAARPNAVVDALNAGAFPPDALDRGDFVAIAGRAQVAIPRFNAALEALHAPVGGAEEPSSPRAIVALSYVHKELAFDEPFDHLRAGIDFDGALVEAFGIDRDAAGERKAALSKQVRVTGLDDDGDEPPEFLVELSVTGGRDHLYLARIAPPASLAAGWSWVEAHRSALREDPRLHALEVPKLAFDVDWDAFDELRGVRLRGADGLFASESERIQFRLDENGAELTSVFRTKGEEEAPVFSGPFLVALVQDGARRPYFLAWIANDELLTPLRPRGR